MLYYAFLKSRRGAIVYIYTESLTRDSISDKPPFCFCQFNVDIKYLISLFASRNLDWFSTYLIVSFHLIYNIEIATELYPLSIIWSKPL